MTLELRVASTTYGTILFLAGQTLGTFTIASPITLTVNAALLSVRVLGAADVNAADITITLKGSMTL